MSILGAESWKVYSCLISSCFQSLLHSVVIVALVVQQLLLHPNIRKLPLLFHTFLALVWNIVAVHTTIFIDHIKHWKQGTPSTDQFLFTIIPMDAFNQLPFFHYNHLLLLRRNQSIKAVSTYIWDIFPLWGQYPFFGLDKIYELPLHISWS